VRTLGFDVPLSKFMRSCRDFKAVVSNLFFARAPHNHL